MYRKNTTQFTFLVKLKLLSTSTPTIELEPPNLNNEERILFWSNELIAYIEDCEKPKASDCKSRPPATDDELPPQESGVLLFGSAETSGIIFLFCFNAK